MIIEPISRQHNRKLFDCGDDEGNRFLREQALQDQDKDMSRTMVLIDEADQTRIIGYHTLAMRQVRQEDIPKDKPKMKRSIPVVLLARVARS